MCYLFRNALELVLKDIIFELYKVDEALKIIVGKKHSIWQLWCVVEIGIIGHLDISENEERLLNFRFKIRELHDYDATADKFRYPVNKKLTTYFNATKHFNIKSYYSFFDESIEFLVA